MAERDDDLSFLVESARRSIALQRRRHNRLLAVGDQRRGRGLVTHIDETLGAVEAQLTLSQARFAAARTDVERDTVLSTLRLLNGFLADTQQASTWVAAAADQKLGVGGLRAIDEAADKLVGTDADVISVPNDSFRFATIWSPFTRILDRLRVTPRTSAFPMVIFFPSEETHSLLLEPLLIHEVAHSAVARNALVDRVLAHRVGRRQFDRAFSTTATAVMKATSTSRAKAKILIEYHLRRWLTEYLCDAVAVAFCGPSYVYAFASIVAAESSTELQESHPPTSLRIRLLLDHLDKLGWSALMQSHAPRVDGWLRHLSSAAPPAASAHHRFLVEVTNEFIPPLQDEVAALHGGIALAPSTFAAQSSELEAFLRRRILPAQLPDGSPADRRSVVLAGWLHVLAQPDTEGSEGDDPRSLPRGLANWEFGAFLDKAVEMSSVLEAWRAK